MKMKRIAAGTLALVLTAGCLSGCGGPGVKLLDEPVINYGETQLYSQEDMDAAIAIIKEEMDTWGITYNLQDISYGGDELSADGMAYVNTLTDNYGYEACQVFLVDFVCLSEKTGFEKNKLYEDWEWYIIKDKDNNDAWLFFTNGYISKYMYE